MSYFLAATLFLFDKNTTNLPTNHPELIEMESLHVNLIKVIAGLSKMHKYFNFRHIIGGCLSVSFSEIYLYLLLYS